MIHFWERRTAELTLYNLPQFLSTLQFATVLRKQSIEMVLATDMKLHFSAVSTFTTKFGASSQNSLARAASNSLLASPHLPLGYSRKNSGSHTPDNHMHNDPGNGTLMNHVMSRGHSRGVSTAPSQPLEPLSHRISRQTSAFPGGVNEQGLCNSLDDEVVTLAFQARSCAQTSCVAC